MRANDGRIDGDLTASRKLPAATVIKVYLKIAHN
jgi:hypothetical protein